MRLFSKAAPMLRGDRLANTPSLDEVPLAKLVSAVARRRRAAQPPPRQKIMRPCAHCGEPYGAREMRKHVPTCRKRRVRLVAGQDALRPIEQKTDQRLRTIGPMGLGLKRR